MPMSEAFKSRLFPLLPSIIHYFRTPFHIYDEVGIRQTGTALREAFAPVAPFREYFAVKALPNPYILRIMQELEFGFDCSSIPELTLARQLGARGQDIMFTSNNTSQAEFEAAAAEGGCILNLDDISLIPKIPVMPDLICFRYNPGTRYTGNAIIGNPLEAKFGVPDDDITQAYQLARERGVQRFGLHAMLVSNELNDLAIIQTVTLLFETASWISEQLKIVFEFINIGGGWGIPYHPDQQPLHLNKIVEDIIHLIRKFQGKNGYAPQLYMESGRYMTGPHGALVTQAINHKDTYRRYIGVDASMSALMRPGIYGAYHHIDVLGKEGQGRIVDVAGSLCENNDKFAVQRMLPEIKDGDILIIHDTGAHGHAMGFNYNGRLRPKELLLRADGAVELIRREETLADYLATLQFEPKILRLL